MYRIREFLAALMAGGVVLCTGAGLAAEGTRSREAQWSPTTRPDVSIPDVALDERGVLRGLVVDAQGIPQPGATVRVVRANRETIQIKTNQAGRFSIWIPRGGVYRIETGERQLACRVWTHGAAPPAANQGILIVSHGEALRATMGPANIFASDRFLLGTAITGAAAIPVAIYSNRGSGS